MTRPLTQGSWHARSLALKGRRRGAGTEFAGGRCKGCVLKCEICRIGLSTAGCGPLGLNGLQQHRLASAITRGPGPPLRLFQTETALRMLKTWFDFSVAPPTQQHSRVSVQLYRGCSATVCAWRSRTCGFTWRTRPWSECRSTGSRRAGELVLVCRVMQSNQFCRAAGIAMAFRGKQVAVMIGGFHVSGILALFPAVSPEIQQLWTRA